MRHFLSKLPGSKLPEIKISAARYRALERASGVLHSALAIEEKYAILIENFLALEKEELSRTAELTVRTRIKYEDFFEIRLALNTRLANLLTSGRMYTDRLGALVSDCLPGKRNVEKKVTDFLEALRKKDAEYRFMKALRNHAQHFGTPVHNTQQGASRSEQPLDGYIEYRLQYFAKKERLAEDDGFPKGILKELPDQIDLKQAARGCVEALSKLHAAIREWIEPNCVDARAQFEDTLAEYRDDKGKRSSYVYACKFEGTKEQARVLVMLDWDDIRLRIKKRNRNLANQRFVYVASKDSKLAEADKVWNRKTRRMKT